MGVTVYWIWFRFHMVKRGCVRVSIKCFVQMPQAWKTGNFFIYHSHLLGRHTPLWNTGLGLHSFQSSGRGFCHCFYGKAAGCKKEGKAQSDSKSGTSLCWVT